MLEHHLAGRSPSSTQPQQREHQQNFFFVLDPRDFRPSKPQQVAVRNGAPSSEQHQQSSEQPVLRFGHRNTITTSPSPQRHPSLSPQRNGETPPSSSAATRPPFVAGGVVRPGAFTDHSLHADVRLDDTTLGYASTLVAVSKQPKVAGVAAVPRRATSPSPELTVNVDKRPARGPEEGVGHHQYPGGTLDAYQPLLNRKSIAMDVAAQQRRLQMLEESGLPVTPRSGAAAASDNRSASAQRTSRTSPHAADDEHPVMRGVSPRKGTAVVSSSQRALLAEEPANAAGDDDIVESPPPRWLVLHRMAEVLQSKKQQAAEEHAAEEALQLEREVAAMKHEQRLLANRRLRSNSTGGGATTPRGTTTTAHTTKLNQGVVTSPSTVGAAIDPVSLSTAPPSPTASRRSSHVSAVAPEDTTHRFDIKRGSHQSSRSSSIAEHPRGVPAATFKRKIAPELEAILAAARSRSSGAKSTASDDSQYHVGSRRTPNELTPPPPAAPLDSAEQQQQHEEGRDDTPQPQADLRAAPIPQPSAPHHESAPATEPLPQRCCDAHSISIASVGTHSDASDPTPLPSVREEHVPPTYSLQPAVTHAPPPEHYERHRLDGQSVVVEGNVSAAAAVTIHQPSEDRSGEVGSASVQRDANDARTQVDDDELGPATAGDVPLAAAERELRSPYEVRIEVTPMHSCAGAPTSSAVVQDVLSPSYETLDVPDANFITPPPQSPTTNWGSRAGADAIIASQQEDIADDCQPLARDEGTSVSEASHEPTQLDAVIIVADDGAVVAPVVETAVSRSENHDSLGAAEACHHRDLDDSPPSVDMTVVAVPPSTEPLTIGGPHEELSPQTQVLVTYDETPEPHADAVESESKIAAPIALPSAPPMTMHSESERLYNDDEEDILPSPVPEAAVDDDDDDEVRCISIERNAVQPTTYQTQNRAQDEAPRNRDDEDEEAVAFSPRSAMEAILREGEEALDAYERAEREHHELIVNTSSADVRTANSSITAQPAFEDHDDVVPTVTNTVGDEHGSTELMQGRTTPPAGDMGELVEIPTILREPPRPPSPRMESTTVAAECTTTCSDASAPLHWSHHSQGAAQQWHQSDTYQIDHYVEHVEQRATHADADDDDDECIVYRAHQIRKNSSHVYEGDGDHVLSPPVAVSVQNTLPTSSATQRLSDGAVRGNHLPLPRSVSVATASTPPTTARSSSAQGDTDADWAELHADRPKPKAAPAVPKTRWLPQHERSDSVEFNFSIHSDVGVYTPQDQPSAYPQLPPHRSSSFTSTSGTMGPMQGRRHRWGDSPQYHHQPLLAHRRTGSDVPHQDDGAAAFVSHSRTQSVDHDELLVAFGCMRPSTRVQHQQSF